MNYFVDPSCDPLKFPCGVCKKNIAKNHRAITCIICKYKVHFKCNKLDASTYDKILRENQQTICIKCKESIFPFQTLTGDQFITTASKGLNINVDNFYNSCSPSTSLKNFFKEINNYEKYDFNNDENPTSINCKYFDINSFNYCAVKNQFSLFHINIGSLSLHKDELETLSAMLEYNFDIITISETKLIVTLIIISILKNTINTTPTLSLKRVEH